MLDIDLPRVAPVTGEHAQERGFEQALSAALRRDDVLGAVWRVFEFSAERQPVVLSTPGGGYHLYLPLCRDERRDPRQRPWPLRFSRQWLEHHLDQHRLGFQPGLLELYPTGVPLREKNGRAPAPVASRRDAVGEPTPTAPARPLRLLLVHAEEAWQRAHDSPNESAAAAPDVPLGAREACSTTAPTPRSELAELVWRAFDRLDPSDPRRQ